MKRLALLAAALAAAFHVQAQVVTPAEPSASASAPVAAPPPSAEAGRRAYTSTYVEGYKLLAGWLDQGETASERAQLFGRLLDEPLTPGAVRVS